LGVAEARVSGVKGTGNGSRSTYSGLKLKLALKTLLLEKPGALRIDRSKRRMMILGELSASARRRTTPR